MNHHAPFILCCCPYCPAALTCPTFESSRCQPLPPFFRPAPDCTHLHSSSPRPATISLIFFHCYFFALSALVFFHSSYFFFFAVSNVELIFAIFRNSRLGGPISDPSHHHLDNHDYHRHDKKALGRVGLHGRRYCCVWRCHDHESCRGE